MTPDQVEQAASWQARLLSDRCSDLDRDRFSAWLAESEAHHKAYDLVSQIWLSGSFAPSSRSAPLVRRAALGVLTLAAAGVLAAPRSADARTIRTARGETRHVNVGGCLVQMDACSILRLGPHKQAFAFEQGRFAVSVRPVSGAAGFGCGDWRVWGRPGEYGLDVTPARMSVAVLSGGLSLTCRGQTDVVLTAGQVMVLDRRTRRVSVTTGRVDDLLAWRQGQAIFRNTPLDQAVAEMARYSDRPVVLLSPALAPMRLSGVFHTHDPKRFFNALAHLLPLRVNYAPDRITIVKL